MSLSDDLCTECGQLKSTPLEKKPDYSDRKPGKSEEFFSMTRNMLFRYMPFMIIGIVMLSIGASHIGTRVGDTAGIVVAVIDILFIIATVMTAINASKCYVCVYQNCITGKIPANIPCFTKNFTVYLDDIIRVNMHGIGSNSGFSKSFSDSHPIFIIVTTSGPVRIKGISDSQALKIRAYLHAFRRK